MKHFYLLSLLVLLLPEAAKAQFAWYGANGKAQVETGLLGDDESCKWQGLWWYFVDKADGSESELVWDVDGTIINDNMIETCKGISGTAVFKHKKNQDVQNQVGVAFYVVGVSKEGGKGMAADASDWKGLAVRYSSDIDMTVRLGLGDNDWAIGYANPQCTLPAAPNGSFVRIPWSMLKQPSWYQGSTKISGANAAKKLVSVQFIVSSPKVDNKCVDGSYHFKLDAVGSYDMSEVPTAITDVKSNVPNNGIIFDLNGRQVTKPTKGIYIKDGKKVAYK